MIFDFDGTCTIEEEGAGETFLSSHRAGLAVMLGKSVEWVTEEFRVAREQIAADPAAYGWELGGKIIAPALVDVFVEGQVCAQVLLRRLGEDLCAWDERLNSLYQEHYLKYTTGFRPEMLEVFGALRDRGIPFYVVSNSDPAKVCQRLAALGEDAEWINTLVHGFAKKYVVTEDPSWVPEMIRVPFLDRPVYLRKGHYYEVLNVIRDAHGGHWRDFLVVGDIAELDLALPVHLGAHAMLMLGPNTPEYERNWVHPSIGRAITDLREVLDAV